MAAEVGTRKVITDHSTVGVVVTTDGSITDIPRKQYEECEQRVINELRDINKPFVILLNSTSPEGSAAQKLAEEMRRKYKAAVIPVCCPDLSEEDIRKILMELLYAFPLREVRIHTAGWLSGLECSHWLREAVFSAIRQSAKEMKAVRDVKAFEKLPEICEYIENVSFMETDLGTGSAKVAVSVSPSLFYTILGEKTGLDIHSDGELMSILTELCEIKKKYQRFSPALEEAMSTGYGIVMPELSEMSLEEPEIIKQGGKYGVRLKASAPSIHLMKATINTAVSPIVGTERQSEELIMYLFDGFEEDSTKIWTSNIFGKSLQDLVGEGLRAKLGKMPVGARMKLQETLERVINEGCGGLICFIL
ncbi:MAG: stage IV sporulation protein A, partial [Ruminococcus sp.]